MDSHHDRIKENYTRRTSFETKLGFFERLVMQFTMKKLHGGSSVIKSNWFTKEKKSCEFSALQFWPSQVLHLPKSGSLDPAGSL